MKFKKYIKESVETLEKEEAITFVEDLGNPDDDIPMSRAMNDIYEPIRKLIKDGKYEEAKKELDAFDADIDEMEADNARRRFFKWPKFVIEGQRKQVAALRATIPAESIEESVDDMDRRCEKCNTLLNDGGTCPKCDDGEEDYEDNTDVELEEELSVREKLLQAYPELNFDRPVTEDIQTEELSNREKLEKAFPGEFNFDNETVTEEVESSDDWYDDDYDIEDDVELDRRHAALYGGDRMYCKCGHKLAYDEYGSYCPECEPRDFE